MALVNKNFEDLFEFSRASEATYWDSSGVLQTAGVDEPRFSYDRSTQEPVGILIEGEATNHLLNSDTPATQTVNGLSGQFTMSVYGDGDVDVEGSVDGVIGNASDGSPLTFTLSEVQDVTVTVNGSVDYFQLEDGQDATSVIITSSTSATRSADTLTLKSGSFYNGASGTFEITGNFAGFDIFPDTPITVNDARGNGSVVITYDSVKSTIYSNGRKQYVDDAISAIPSIIGEGVSGVKLLKYFPYMMSDQDAISRSIGDVIPNYSYSLIDTALNNYWPNA